jgi:hypothetical protein
MKGEFIVFVPRIRGAVAADVRRRISGPILCDDPPPCVGGDGVFSYM